ncbi:hypothetical protein [Lachnospira multipara]|uniref:hypothetical protein n=1 Tax=Lachnospira multipara TaxID=28051 RepID=UPI0004846CE8|nr:hypothetical protein [Lachnospira multipara]
MHDIWNPWHGCYKVKSGEILRVCMTYDFFLKEADDWRLKAWHIIEQRPDVKYECEEFNVSFTFCGTGRRFYKDRKLYKNGKKP